MFRTLSMNIGAVLVAAAMTMSMASVATAQTISQPLGDIDVNGPGAGQSFTATVTGTLTEIQLRSLTATTSTVHFYNGLGSGTDGNVGSPVLSQSVNFVAQPSSQVGFQTIVLDTPLPIVAGNSYAFVVSGVPLAFRLSDEYPGGRMITNFNGGNPGWDLAFTATEVAVVEIPTMTEWAMILMGLMLAGGAVVAIQRRRMMA